MLFGSSNSSETNKRGLIRYFPNFEEGSLDGEDFAAHDEQGVNKINITFNDEKLISVGNDGIICIF